MCSFIDLIISRWKKVSPVEHAPPETYICIAYKRTNDRINEKIAENTSIHKHLATDELSHHVIHY